MNEFRGRGNLGKDPVVRRTQSGKTVATFSIGMNRVVNGQQATDWLAVTCWDELADGVAANLKKGAYVEVAGRISSRSYQAQDGSKRYVTECVAYDIALVNGVKARPQNGQAPRGGNFSQFGLSRPDPQRTQQPQYQQTTLGAQPQTAYVNPNDEGIPF